MTQLIISIDDISRLSGFDGNIDNDSINPFIFMAQNSEIKRILGVELYNKIVSDYENDILSGNYLAIYNDYIATILAYFTCSYYLQLGVPKVSQNGVYLVTPEKTEQLFNQKSDKMAEKYEKLATGLEIKLLEVLNLLNLPERPSPNDTKAKSNFNWMRP
jgi:hypothetical protein